MRKIIILFSLVVWSITLHAQRYTISGYITDKSNGETLISASVFDEISKKGTVTNNYGHYSISLNTGEVDLSYSYVGYTTEKSNFRLTKDTVINVKMDASIALREVTVVAGATKWAFRAPR